MWNIILAISLTTIYDFSILFNMEFSLIFFNLLHSFQPFSIFFQSFPIQHFFMIFKHSAVKVKVRFAILNAFFGIRCNSLRLERSSSRRRRSQGKKSRSCRRPLEGQLRSPLTATVSCHESSVRSALHFALVHVAMQRVRRRMNKEANE